MVLSLIKAVIHSRNKEIHILTMTLRPSLIQRIGGTVVFAHTYYFDNIWDEILQTYLSVPSARVA